MDFGFSGCPWLKLPKQRQCLQQVMRGAIEHGQRPMRDADVACECRPQWNDLYPLVSFRFQRMLQGEHGGAIACRHEALQHFRIIELNPGPRHTTGGAKPCHCQLMHMRRRAA